MMHLFSHLTKLLFVVWTRVLGLVRLWYRQQFRLRLPHGQGLVEYALILVLIAIVVIGVLTTLGIQTYSAFDEVACAMRGGEFHRDRGNGKSNRCR